jgi:hypothetical protein
VLAGPAKQPLSREHEPLSSPLPNAGQAACSAAARRIAMLVACHAGGQIVNVDVRVVVLVRGLRLDRAQSGTRTLPTQAKICIHLAILQ